MTFHSCEGIGKTHQRLFGYSQAVRIGDKIACSGQGSQQHLVQVPSTLIVHTGGFDSKGEISTNIEAEINQAFANVELSMKEAGGRGMSQVYRIRSYHIPLDERTLAVMVDNIKKWFPDHQPIWTSVGVTHLAGEGMRVEIEASAHIETS